MSQQVVKASPRRKTEEAPVKGKGKTRNEVLDDIDGVLDEIDDVLEENAEDFVKNYVQKGGQ